MDRRSSHLAHPDFRARRHWPAWLLPLLFFLVAFPLAAQKPDRDAQRLDSLLRAPRPVLTVDADSNDVDELVTWGKARQEMRRPAEAAVFFLWASRLSPARAEPMLLAWYALWEAVPGARRRHERGDKRFAATGVGERVDSLVLRAIMRDPFAAPENPRLNPFRRPWLAQLRRDAARDSNAIVPRLLLAVELYHDRSYDSTVARLNEVLRALDRQERGTLRPVYHSRETFHFMLAQAQAARGDRAAARAAYQQALVENAGFYAAHARLGYIAWENWADTTTMIAEYDAAVGIAPHDAALRNDYGAMLLTLERPAEALAQFEAGLATAPDYAFLYYNAALAAERAGRPDAALAHYRGFVSRASRRLVVQRTAADKRIAALTATK